jgi:hypothetical protein
MDGGCSSAAGGSRVFDGKAVEVRPGILNAQGYIVFSQECYRFSWVAGPELAARRTVFSRRFQIDFAEKNA